MRKIKNRPVVLVILDGWGVAPDAPGNAINLAKKKNISNYISTYPVLTLLASGEAVGLGWGEMGNSEVGHLNLGSGRIFYQNLPKINKAISNKEFFSKQAFLQAIEHTQKNRSALHLMGLVSTGGVHSHIDHLFALLELAKEQKVKNIYVHLFLDGRDTIFNSGKGFIEDVINKIIELKVNAKIATISGRYYAMDRDNHWERTSQAFFAMARGESMKKFTDPVEAVTDSYDHKVYDEEFVPVVIEEDNHPVGLVKDKDAIIFFNFRSDRARQISQTFVLPDFNKFDRQTGYKNLFFVAMTMYDKDLPFDAVAFPTMEIENPLAKVIADSGLKQLHIAETEKYAHVTFFFNGGQEKAFNLEERILIPSPRVASYDSVPEMSANKITDSLIKVLSNNQYNFIVVNFANPDMVSHTGNLQASIKACEVVDKCLGKIVPIVLSKDGVLLITGDHGNAEELQNIKTAEIDKEHSTNPVPLIIIGKQWEGKNIGHQDSLGGDLSLVTPSGVLSDIAPTILKVIGLKVPEDMTGTPLV